MIHHEMNIGEPSFKKSMEGLENLESKAVLIFVRIAFVLVFLGERENSDMTVSGNPPKYASC